MNKHMSAILLTFLSLSCQSLALKSSKSSDLQSSGQFVPPPTCASGTAAMFHLVAPQVAPDPSGITYPATLRPYEVLSPAPKMDVRIDVCIREDVSPPVAEVIQVVDVAFSAPKVMKFGSHSVANGVYDALMGQNIEKLLIDVLPEADNASVFGGNSKYQIRGWNAASGPYVTASFMSKDNPEIPRIWILLGGTLSYGNPMVDGECGISETPGTARWSVGSAKFAAELCTFQGGGQTEGYRFRSLEVDDSALGSLPSESKWTLKEAQIVNQSPSSATPASLPAAQFIFRHHNQVDELVVFLPRGTYRFKSDAVLRNSSVGITYGNAAERTWTKSCRTYRACDF